MNQTNCSYLCPCSPIMEDQESPFSMGLYRSLVEIMGPSPLWASTGITSSCLLLFSSSLGAAMGTGGSEWTQGNISLCDRLPEITPGIKYHCLLSMFYLIFTDRPLMVTLNLWESWPPLVDTLHSHIPPCWALSRGISNRAILLFESIMVWEAWESNTQNTT